MKTKIAGKIGIIILVGIISLNFPGEGKETLSIKERLTSGEKALGVWDFNTALEHFNEILKETELTRNEQGQALKGRLLTRALLLTEYNRRGESYQLFKNDAFELLEKHPKLFDPWCANRIKNPVITKDDEKSAKVLLNFLDSRKDKYTDHDYHLLRGELMTFWSRKQKGKEYSLFTQKEFKKALKAHPKSLVAWEMYLDVLWERGKKMSFFEKLRFKSMIKGAKKKGAQGLKYSPFYLYEVYLQKRGKSSWEDYFQRYGEAMKEFPKDPRLPCEYAHFVSESDDNVPHLIEFLEEFGKKEEAGEFEYKNLSQRQIPVRMLYLLVYYYKRTNRLEDALKTCEKIQEMSPHYAEVHYNKSIILESLSDKEKDKEKEKKRELLTLAIKENHLQEIYLFQDHSKELLEKRTAQLQEELERMGKPEKEDKDK